jgi:hypothetical protein
LLLLKTPLFRCPSFPHKGLFPTKDLPVILLLFTLFAQILCPAENASAVSYRYLQQTGSKSQEFVWTLKVGKENRLTSESSMDRYVTVMDPSFATLQWRLDNPAEATEVTVRREKDVLQIRGTFKGKLLKRDVEIDSHPWYQALSLSLRALCDPKKESLEFWTLRPDNLEVHKLKAVRKGLETLTVEGKQVLALRLEVSLRGLAGLFWHCSYWLRESDGVFLRYQGPSGPPGWPETEVRLIGAEGSLHQNPSTGLLQ